MGLFRYTWRSFSREIVLAIGGLLFVVPLYLLLTISLKTTQDAYLQPLAFPTHPHWSSYKEAVTATNAGVVQVSRAFVNSVVITVGSVAAVIVLGSLAAYAIARRPSKLGSAMYITFLAGIIVPYQLALIPLYVMLRKLHLGNTYAGMILLYTGLLMPLTVFLYTGFVRTLPRDYEEAAQVDGASRLRTFVRVVMPLLKPITGTVAVLTSIIVWNDFFVQVIFLSGSTKSTLPVAIYALAGADLTNWNIVFAAVAVALLPMIGFFVFAQRTMVRGFSGGVRG
jgi:raffinose/stachyose/melibiose transport system permease protein